MSTQDLILDIVLSVFRGIIGAHDLYHERYFYAFLWMGGFSFLASYFANEHTEERELKRYNTFFVGVAIFYAMEFGVSIIILMAILASMRVCYLLEFKPRAVVRVVHAGHM